MMRLGGHKGVWGVSKVLGKACKGESVKECECILFDEMNETGLHHSHEQRMNNRECDRYA